jgi:FkbM family methyltransferase
VSRHPIAADDHRATIEHFLDVLTSPLETVVHVGAHTGEEVDAYRRHGARRILLIEANPANCAALAEAFGADPDVEVIHAAVTDHDGTDQLLIHTNARGETESASLLRLKRLGEIVSTLHTERAVEVPAKTLDRLLEEAGVDGSEIGLLVCDVQGAELSVLRGAPRTLSAAKTVLTEVVLVELYEGAAGEEEVAGLLVSAGFYEVAGLDYELYEGDRRFRAWGDRLFVRETLLPK